jgi:hypothetical protein
VAKKVAMFEKLKREMFEEIRVKVCDFLINDCDICPTFISSRCQEPCNDKETEEVDTNRTVGNP